MLFAGRAYPELAGAIADELGLEPTPADTRDFANGEIYVRFEESVRGCDAFVIESHSAPINQWVMEQLIMVDALKRASAKRITVVAPFYPCARALERAHRCAGRVFPVCAKEKEREGWGADLRAAHRRPVQDRRCRPAH